MEIIWDKNKVDLQKVLEISRGKPERVFKYLNQFLELIPERIHKLVECLETENRHLAKQVIHQMSPQIQFFGISAMAPMLIKVDKDLLDMSLEDLKSLIKKLISKLEIAVVEIENILKQYFPDSETERSQDT